MRTLALVVSDVAFYIHSFIQNSKLSHDMFAVALFTLQPSKEPCVAIDHIIRVDSILLQRGIVR